MQDVSISILGQFSQFNDPRVDRTKRHKLTDVIAIELCAVICGANGWTDIELFGKSKREWLETFLELPNGIPSHDTFGRVFGMLVAEQFERRSPPARGHAYGLGERGKQVYEGRGVSGRRQDTEAIC